MKRRDLSVKQVPLLSSIHLSQRLSYNSKPLFRPSSFSTCFSEQGEEIRAEQLCSRRSVRRQPLAYLGNALFGLSLLSQHPALQDRSHGQPEGKALLGTEGNGCGCLLLDCLSVATELMERSRNAES